jgi:hypothetical protein
MVLMLFDHQIKSKVSTTTQWFVVTLRHVCSLPVTQGYVSRFALSSPWAKIVSPLQGYDKRTPYSKA